MSNIAERQNVLIYRTLVNPNVWDEQINIDFIPDDVIVRSIMYYSNGADPGVSFIRTNLVKDNIIGSIDDPSVQNPQQHFTVNKPIKGAYNFQIVNTNGTIGNRVGQLHIALEFVRYK